MTTTMTSTQAMSIRVTTETSKADPALAHDLPPRSLSTGESVRLACRNASFASVTSGLAPTYLQVNLLAVPSQFAGDVRTLCKRNPVACPLLAESVAPGCWDRLKSCVEGVSDEQIASNVDLRHDFPGFNVYEDGHLARRNIADVEQHWTDDHVAFLIGCSFSFEAALAEQGLTPPHVKRGTNVPMYRTNIPLCPAGVFRDSTYVVSMRMYDEEEIERVRSVTRPFIATHGEPLAWGWDGAQRIGIDDIRNPQWGDPPLTTAGNHMADPIEEGSGNSVPVFWACGVTPQEAVTKARLKGTVLAHAPGRMMVLDLRDWDVIPK